MNCIWGGREEDTWCPFSPSFPPCSPSSASESGAATGQQERWKSSLQRFFHILCWNDFSLVSPRSDGYRMGPQSTSTSIYWWNWKVVSKERQRTPFYKSRQFIQCDASSSVLPSFLHFLSCFKAYKYVSSCRIEQSKGYRKTQVWDRESLSQGTHHHVAIPSHATFIFSFLPFSPFFSSFPSSSSQYSFRCVGRLDWNRSLAFGYANKMASWHGINIY